MNKLDFLRQLDKELRVLDAEERKELLDFYEERFHSGKIYENKSEQEIISELESPKVIARNILAEYGVSPRFVKTKEERYSGVDTGQLILLICFDVFAASWIIPTLFSVAFSLFVALFSYVGAFPILLDNPTWLDYNLFALITAVYFLLFMFALVVLDFSILVTKKIIIWHLNVFKYKNRDKWIKRFNKTSIDGFVKKRRGLRFFKSILVIGSFVVIFVTGARILFDDSNYLDSLISQPIVSDMYTEDVTDDIANGETWSLSTNFEMMDVEIREYSGTEIAVTHRYAKDKDFVISIDPDTNEITMSNKHTNVYIPDFKSLLSLIGNSDEIVIEIPEGLVLSIVDVKTGHGLVDVREVTTNALTIDSAYGNIIVKDMTANSNFTLDTDYGDVVLEDIEGSGYNISVDTAYGTIKAYDVNFNNYTLNTDYGDIKLTNINLHDKDGVNLNAETSYGDITFKNVYVATIDIHTDYGDIEYNNIDLTFNHTSYKKSTDYGDITGNQN